MTGLFLSRPGWLGELRSAAMALAGHGWPVLRGTFRASERWCGRPDAVGLRPVDDDWSTELPPLVVLQRQFGVS